MTPAKVRYAKGPTPEWKAMRVEFESEEQALFLVMGMGVRARVLAPAALFDRVMGEAMTVAAVAQRAWRRRRAQMNDM